MITPSPNETYEQWVERSRQYELELAKTHISNGHNPAKVLEKMAYRLTAKMLNPLYEFVKEDQISNYDPTTSLAEYKEYFELKNIKPKPDHVLDD
jgi:glutamyl-tRNA reductase